MSIALTIFGVSFAAVCIWLTVRIINRRERWAKWTLAAVIGVPALYPLSFGPVCWRASRPLAIMGIMDGYIPIVYWPICAEARNSSGTLAKAINWYATVGMPSDSFIFMPNDSSGFTWDMKSNGPRGSSGLYRSNPKAMTSDRKKPSAGFWITVALVAVLVAYPLSSGPAIWIAMRTSEEVLLSHPVNRFYAPVWWFCDHGPQPVRDLANWWLLLWGS